MTSSRRFCDILLLGSAALVLQSCSAMRPAFAAPGGSLPTATVIASQETAAVATVNADAADDPAIWRNPADPAASLIIGTDKKAGLYVYGLDGGIRDFNNAGSVNNVDVATVGDQVIVVASDRNDRLMAHVALFALDPAGRLRPLGRIAAGPGEAYGLCLYRAADALYAFLVLKDGTIRQVALDVGGAAPRGTIVRTMKLATQSEGCAVDPRTARLYVAEEDVGLWRFDARPQGPITPVRIAAADGRAIVADAEGVALALDGDGNGGHLVVSSQGDNAYAVYRLSDDAYVGRFRIGAGAFGATQETDGIDIATGDFGPAFPDGLMVAQDGVNPPRAQNFKLVSWARIVDALKLNR